MKHTLLARGGALALTAALTAGVGGCSVNSPVQTQYTKAVADGVNAELGDDVSVRNLALVSGEKGGAATVIGAVENRSAEDLTLTITAGEASATADVAAHGQTNLSEDGKVVLDAVDAAPGDMTQVEVSTAGAGGGTTVLVPVLDPTGYYEDIAPEGWTPTPSETGTEHEGSAEESGH